MVVIQIANNSNFKSDSMKDFCRYQKVECVYRLAGNELILTNNPFTEDWSQERKNEKTRDILSGHYITYCAFEDGRIVGLIMLNPKLDQRRMIVDSFHVSQEKRRMGIGRKLFEAACGEASLRHAQSLYISACSAKETIDFYLALGCKISQHPIEKCVSEEPFDIQLEYALQSQKETKMVIETERLFLREMKETDFESLYAVLADSDIMQHYPYTFDETRVSNWIRRNMERYVHEGFGLWAVCLKETGDMIGDCGLTLQPIDGQTLPEIGYHIRKDQQRKGYCKEAASAVRNWAFLHTGYGALYSYCKHTNVPSYKVAESIGMRFFKEYPDEANGITHVSRITRDEWRKLFYSDIEGNNL